jgi:hypothetical protein
VESAGSLACGCRRVQTTLDRRGQLKAAEELYLMSGETVQDLNAAFPSCQFPASVKLQGQAYHRWGMVIEPRRQLFPFDFHGSADRLDIFQNPNPTLSVLQPPYTL